MRFWLITTFVFTTVACYAYCRNFAEHKFRVSGATQAEVRSALAARGQTYVEVEDRNDWPK